MNKKIIHIISRMNVGGPSKIINYYMEHLHDYHYDSILICGRPTAEEGEIKPILLPSIQIIYLDGLSPGSNSWQTFKSFLSLLKIIRKIKPNIIHSHQAKAGAFARIGGFLLRTPKIIHTYHGHVFYGYFSPLKTKLIIFIEKILNLLSHQSIAISPEIFHDITDKYKICNPQKTVLINVGIDTQIFLSLPSPQISKKNFGIPPDKFIIGFIGRLVNIKNPLGFIALAKELSKSNNNLHFVITGDGSLKEKVLRKIKEENLEDFFTILPWVNEVQQVLVCLDLLVMTSINEGTPLIIMEAMAIGIPVASTAVGGIPYLIEHEKTGLIISQDPNLQAEYLMKLISDYGNKTSLIKSAAKEKILKNFSLEVLLRQTVELYNK